MKLQVYIISILIFASCANSRHTAKVKKDEPVVREAPLSERIAFINLKITTDSIAQRNQIAVINKTFTVGHLKNNDGGQIRSGNFLTCILYEDNGNKDTVKLQHPLYPVYEYMNEKNEMALKELKKKEADFFLRYQLKGKTAQLKILETIQGKGQQEIAIINL